MTAILLRFYRPCAGVAVLTLATLTLGQSAGRSVLSGSVVDADGQPVRKTIVTATWLGTPRSWATLRTDSSGAFRFDGLPPGKYDLRATKPGEGTAVIGSAHGWEIGDSIVLSDGEQRTGLRLRFIRTGTISGHVLGPDGNAAGNFTVELLVSEEEISGTKSLNDPASTLVSTTDDRGEYRITGVPPGRYYVRASPPRAQSFSSGTESGNVSLVVPQFLGGGRRLKDAIALTIGGNDDRSGQDFRITAEQPVSIRGRVTGLPAPSLAASVQQPGGRDPGKVSVAVFPISEDLSPGGTGQIAREPDKTFEFGRLAPGIYRVEARAERGAKTWIASQLIEARGSVQDLVLAMAPAAEITGVLRVEGPVGLRPSADTFRIQLLQAGRQTGLSVQVGAGGAFRLPQVPPGDWTVKVSPLTPGVFLKSLRLGDRLVSSAHMEIGSLPSETMAITISASAGKVFGEVEVESGGSRRAGLLLTPAGQCQPADCIPYEVTADEGGKFEFSGVTPGRYRLFAFQGVEATPFRNPEAIGRLHPAGQVVDVVEGATLQVHPKPISAEEALRALQ